MLNLLEVAESIQKHRNFISDLLEINRSRVFPIIPVNLQQKTERLLGEQTKIVENLELAWPESKELLNDLLSCLETFYIPVAEDTTYTFIRNTSKLIHQYILQQSSGVSSLKSVPDDGATS